MSSSQRFSAVRRFYQTFKKREGSYSAVTIAGGFGITFLSMGGLIDIWDDNRFATESWQQAAQVECLGDFAADAARAQVAALPAPVDGQYVVHLGDAFMAESALPVCVAKKMAGERKSSYPTALGIILGTVGLIGLTVGTIGTARQIRRENAEPAPTPA